MKVVKEKDHFVVSLNHGLRGPLPRLVLPIMSQGELRDPELVLGSEDFHNLFAQMLQHVEGRELCHGQWCSGHLRQVREQIVRLLQEMNPSEATAG